MKRIKDKGAVSVGYSENAVPLSYAGPDQTYAGPDQKPLGFALDLCALALDKVKQTLALPDLKVDYAPLPTDTADSALKDGKIDIGCGAAPHNKPSDDADFSIPIYTSELKWIVPRRLRVEREGSRRRRTEVRSVSSADDLRGKTVVLPQGSPATSLVLGISSDRSLGLSIVQGKDYQDSFKLIETGKASAVIGDDILLVGLKANAKSPDAYGFLDEAYPGETYNLLLPKGDAAFKDLVDGALREAMKSGEYAKLYAKWFESPIPPRNVNLDYPMQDSLKHLLKEAEGSSK